MRTRGARKIIYPMRWHGSTAHLRPFSGFGYFGAYSPAPSLIKTTDPEPRLFFRPVEDMTVWKMCKNAYGKDNVFAGIKAVTNSAWNKSHIKYARKGYENYGFDGPQMEKKYDASNPLSTRGSGNAYPTFWLPPLGTLEEPEQVFITEPETGPIPQPDITPPEPEPGPAPPDTPPLPPGTPETIVKYYKGDKGDPGAAGKQGAKGDPGRPPTAAEIAAALAEYMKAHPVAGGEPGPGPTPAQIETAVNKYFETHPMPAGVTPEQIKIAVEQYLTENPPSGVTQAQIDQAVKNYFIANPPPGGPPGEMGPPGPAPTSMQIETAVNKYFEAHPVAGVTPAQVAAAVADYLATHPMEAPSMSSADIEKIVKDYLKKIGGAIGTAAGISPMWAGLGTFVVLGLLIKGTRRA